MIQNTRLSPGKGKRLPPFGEAHTGGFFLEIRALLIQIFALSAYARQWNGNHGINAKKPGRGNLAAAASRLDFM